MLSLSCVDPWPEGSVSLEEEVVTAAAQAEHLDLQDPGCEPCPPSLPSPSQPSPSQPSPSQASPSQALCSAPSTGGSLCLDDSLTSLQWLQEFSILSANGPRPPPLSTHHHQPHLFGHHQQLLGPEAPASPLAGDPASMGMPLTPGKPTAAAYSRMQSLSALPGLVAHGHCPDEVDYKTNAHIKPPYSYATLICMAMQASKKSKITLSCIYKWITDNFCYFRHADPTWQNSIRHNLSLNKCFIKVPRQKDEPGKGGFWKIDPQYAERLLNGAYKKRRMPPVQINPALQNRLQGALAQPRPQLQPRGPGSPMLGQGGELCVDPESQQLLQEFEEATGADQNWDPRQAHRPMLGGWPAGRGLGGGGGGKRKQSSRTGGAKAPRRSSSPLLSLEEQRELGPLKGSFDWDALLDSALSGELSLDGMEPLSPIPLQDQDDQEDQDLTVRGTHICPLQAPGGVAEDNHVLMETQRRCGGGGGGGGDYDEETFLATAFLQSPWQEEEGRADFLCSSTVNLDQLFDLADPLGGGDISIKIESLL